MSISHYLLLFTITIQQINAIELAPPKVTNPPTWSWDTLGSMTFAHTGQSTAYTSKDLQLLSKFPIVQFDKKEMITDQPNVDAIDRFIYAAKAVRDAHTTSTVQILLYINGLIDFPSFQHLYNKRNLPISHFGKGSVFEFEIACFTNVVQFSSFTLPDSSRLSTERTEELACLLQSKLLEHQG